MNLKWNSPNAIAGFILLTSTLVIFGLMLYHQIGGEMARGVIIGHIAAWVEMFILFLYRKKNPDEGGK